MNQHLPEQIFEIVCKLSDKEHKAFQKYCLRKKPTENQASHGYYKLYEVYRKQIGDLKLDEKAIKSEALKFSKSPSDLTQKLNDELLDFITITYKESNTNSIEYVLNQYIDRGAALHQKGLYTLALKSYTDAITEINKIEKNQFNSEFLYLVLKLYSGIINAGYRINNKTVIDSETISSFKEFAQPFFQIAYTAHSTLSQIEQQDIFDNEHFSESAFYGLLNTYLKQRADFETHFKDQGSIFPFNHAFELPKFKNDARSEQTQKTIIDAESFIFQLERMHKALLVNDTSDFENAFDSLNHRLNHSSSMVDFNVDLLLFVYRQIFELKTIYTVKNNQAPLDLKGLRNFLAISNNSIQLFRNDEIKNLALRVELNNLIISFLEKDFNHVIATIEVYNENYKDKKSEYYLDLLLMDIICRMELGGLFDEVVEKKITYFDNFVKKNTCTEFHKKFAGFIKAFHQAAPKDLANVCNKYFNVLEKSQETFNHFHAIYIKWINDKSQTL